MKNRFLGTAKSIKLKSEESLLRYPDSDEIIRQTLSIHSNGSVYFNEYLMDIDADDNRIIRHRYKIGDAIAKGIIDEVINYFSSFDCMLVSACDAGYWDLTIENTTGDKIQFSGALLSEIPRLNFISQRIRQVINKENIWAFDGGSEK